ncbi:MAG: prepilin peptidase [Acidobacteriota bacterium]
MEAEIFWTRFWAASAFAFGLVLGSFANVLAYRLPRRISVVLPGSFCTECGRKVRPYDNVPILAFLWLGGKCRDCLAPISWRHPLVELTSGIVTAGIVARFGPTFEAVVFVMMALFLLVLFLTDLDFHILPDGLTVGGMLGGFAAAGASGLGLVARTRGATTFPESALGATAGAFFLLLVMSLYRFVRAREGMGVGDVKLLAMIGAFLGFELTIATLLIAVLLGSVGGLLLIALRGGDLGTALPFGTYLAVATIVVLFFYEGRWAFLSSQGISSALLAR